MEGANKRVEHKGVNNRLLRDIGWVEVVNGNRDTPRNSDIALRSSDELLQTRKELLSLRKDAAGFIRKVFRSYDGVWVDRCSQIIIDRI